MKLKELRTRNYVSEVTTAEKELLYNWRLEIPEGNSAEIGVGNGGSLAYITGAQEEIGSGKTYAISPWSEKYFKGELIKQMAEWTFPLKPQEDIGVHIETFTREFNKHVPELFPWIEIMPYASFDVTSILKKRMEPLYFIFIDAFHFCPAPYLDTLAFAPYVEVGGMIVYHDWVWGLPDKPKLFECVKKAFNEIRNQSWTVKQHPTVNFGVAKRIK